jgi:predicted enzyme related to lactoylglutathione lyase
MSDGLVKGVDFVTLSSTDLAAAADFYEGKLGLERSSTYRRDSDSEFGVGVEFETGSLTLSVIDSAALGIEFRPTNHPVAFHVDDVEAARAELESRGVTFAAETMDTGVCHMAHFADPDGNALMLHHRYAPRAA